MNFGKFSENLRTFDYLIPKNKENWRTFMVFEDPYKPCALCLQQILQ